MWLLVKFKISYHHYWANMKFLGQYLVRLNTLLNKENVSLENFIKLSDTEGFSDDEMYDLEYIEEKISIWKEMYPNLDEPIGMIRADYIKLYDMIFGDKIPEAAEYITTNRLSISDIYWYQNGNLIDDVEDPSRTSAILRTKLFEISDHILGGMYISK